MTIAFEKIDDAQLHKLREGQKNGREKSALRIAVEKLEPGQILAASISQARASAFTRPAAAKSSGKTFRTAKLNDGRTAIVRVS